MRTGKIGGITVSTMTQTGTALTTSDRARNSSTLLTETSGQVRKMEKMDTTTTVMMDTTTTVMMDTTMPETTITHSTAQMTVKITLNQWGESCALKGQE